MINEKKYRSEKFWRVMGIMLLAIFFFNFIPVSAKNLQRSSDSIAPDQRSVTKVDTQAPQAACHYAGDTGQQTTLCLQATKEKNGAAMDFKIYTLAPALNNPNGISTKTVKTYLSASQFHLTRYSESFGGQAQDVPIQTIFTSSGEKNTFSLVPFPCEVSMVQAFNNQGTSSTGAFLIVKTCGSSTSNNMPVRSEPSLACHYASDNGQQTTLCILAAPVSDDNKLTLTFKVFTISPLVPHDPADPLNIVRTTLATNQFDLTMHSESVGSSAEQVAIQSKNTPKGPENTFSLKQFPCGVSTIQAFNSQDTMSTGALEVIRQCKIPVM